jgi:hypothetical protein
VPPAALLLFGAKPAELDVEFAKQSGRVELAGGVRVLAKPVRRRPLHYSHRA